MSLIEKLGGYEIKIPDFECYLYHRESLDNYREKNHLNVFDMTKKRAEIISKALLEYRREHNIFEVGDKVVIPTSKYFKKVYKVSYFVDNIGFRCIDYRDLSDRSQITSKIENFRHATDKEIKQGYRDES